MSNGDHEAANGLPDKEFEITDDIKAQAILLAAGMLRELTIKSEVDDGAVVAGRFDHPTHWLLGIRYYGKQNPADNGYIVWGWPKRKHPRNVIKEALKQLGFESPLGSKTIRYDDPPANSN